MDLRSWLQQWLGIHDLHQRVAELDRRIGTIEMHVDSTLKHFGSYRTRTDEELLLMRSQLETVIKIVADVTSVVENQADIQRAARLKRRLQNNLTRINNAFTRRIS